MQRTATEINKESDSTIKLVNKKLIKFNTAITRLVKDVAYYLFGLSYIDKINALSISYPSAGLSNPRGCNSSGAFWVPRTLAKSLHCY